MVHFSGATGNYGIALSLFLSSMDSLERSVWKEIGKETVKFLSLENLISVLFSTSGSERSCKINK